MQMEHSLAGTGPVVHVEAEIRQPFLFSHPAGHQQQVPEQGLIRLFSIGQLGNRLLGDYQEMGGRLGIDIPKGQTLVVFENDIGRDLPVDDLGEKGTLRIGRNERFIGRKGVARFTARTLTARKMFAAGDVHLSGSPE